jgi:hypothetical protein
LSLLDASKPPQNELDERPTAIRLQ